MFGPESAQVATTLNNLAAVQRKRGRPDEARATLERAFAAYGKAYGPDHALVAYPLDQLGLLREQAGDLSNALGQYTRALAIRTQALGPDHPITLTATAQRARALILLGRCAEARPLVATAIAGLTKAGGDLPELADALALGARCDLADQRAAQALVALDRSLSIKERVQAPPVERGEVRWRRALALWSLGKRDAAVAAARVAETELADDADGVADLAAARRWLAARGR